MSNQDPFDVAAILLAAGVGERLGGVKKAFLHYRGRSLLDHEIARVSPLVQEVVIALRPEDRDRVCNAGCLGSLRVVDGGADRAGSLWNALQATRRDHVLVCDVTRPQLSPALIKRVLEKLAQADVVVPVLSFRVRESIGVMKDGELEAVLPRDGLVLTQTPQAFRRAVLLRCLEHARAHDWKVVSLAGMARDMGVKVAVVSGEPSNRKITFPEDLTAEFAVTDPPRA